jgi:hypothetical protein
MLSPCTTKTALIIERRFVYPFVSLSLGYVTLTDIVKFVNGTPGSTETVMR